MRSEPNTRVLARESDGTVRKLAQGLSWALVLLIVGLFLSPVRRFLPQDFMQFYFAGRLVVSGQVSQIYNRAAYEPLIAEMHQRGETKLGSQIFNRPAFYAYVFAPLGWVSYQTGVRIVFFLNAVLLGVLVWKLPVWFHLPPSMRVWLLGFFPFMWSIGFGQDTLLVTLLVALAVRAIGQGRETRGGILLALALFKPHVLWLTPFALLASGKRRAFYSFLGAGAALAAVSFAIVGTRGVGQWIELLQAPATDRLPERMSNLRAVGIHLGPAGLVPAALAVAASLLVILRRGGFDEQFAGALFGSLLLSPHTYIQDYSVVAIAAALIPSTPLRYLVLLPWTYLGSSTNSLPLALMAILYLAFLSLRLLSARSIRGGLEPVNGACPEPVRD
jgi:hypothetical protein